MHGRIRAFPAAVVAAALLATACGTAAAPRAKVRNDLRAVPVSAQAQQALATADDAFARALWSALAPEDGNVAVSPASIATALQMVYAGAHGETAAEMARVLHLDDNDAPINVTAAASKLLTALAPLAHDKHALLALADEIWLQRNFPVAADFRAAMSTGFDSAFHLADFVGHGEAAREAINAAIAGQTHGRIHDLLPPGMDLRDTRLILTNAIYLKAEWEKPFTPEITQPAPFTRADGAVVHPPTMSTTDEFEYAATNDYQEVRLPYVGGRLAMTLLLPAAGRPLTWPATTPAFRLHTVDLALPKFRFSWDDDLAELLGQLGMPTAFTDSADFSGMSSERLHIGAVRHKAFIAVDENGTEAAAATAVTMVATGGHAPVDFVRLHLDRPFLFRIDDTVTGLPLFLGKVADPTLGA